MLQFFFLIITSIALSATAADKVCLGQGDPKNNFYMNDLNEKIKANADIDRRISENQEAINALNRQIANSLDKSDQTQKILDDEKNKNDNVRNQLNANYAKEKEIWMKPRIEDINSWKKHELQNILRSGKSADEVKNSKLRLEEESKKKLADLETEARAKFANVNSAVSVTNMDFAQKEDKRQNDHDNVVNNIDKLQLQIDALDKQIKNLKKQKEKFRFIDQWQKDRKGHVEEKTADVCVKCAFNNPMAQVQSLIANTKKIIIPHLDKECVVKSLMAKSADNTQRLCENSSDTKNRVSNGDQCVNEDLADYIHWSLNQAINCLSTPGNPIDPNLLFMKLNNESTFRFFFSYAGGQGLMQTTQSAQDEMLGLDPNNNRTLGRKFLARLMHNNNENCKAYKDIFNYESEYKIDEEQSFVGDLKSLQASINHKDISAQDVQDIQDKFKERLAILELKYPKTSKIFASITAVKKMLLNTAKDKSITDDARRRVEISLGIYQRQMEEAAAKENVSPEFLNQLQTTKRFIDALDDPSNFSADEKNTLDNIVKDENKRLDNMKQNYPGYKGRQFKSGPENQCQFISLEEGIHRNILNGVGLFLYYRDGYYNGEQRDGSARFLLKNQFGVSNPPQDLLNKVALAMYGPDGNGGASKKIADRGSDFKNKINNEQFDAAIESAVKYYRDTLKSLKDVENHFNIKDLECTAK